MTKTSDIVLCSPDKTRDIQIRIDIQVNKIRHCPFYLINIFVCGNALFHINLIIIKEI